MSLANTTEKNAIRFSKNRVTSIMHVYKKKLSLIGQTQIVLDGGKVIVITIDRKIGGAPVQQQFDEFKEIMDGLITVNSNSEIVMWHSNSENVNNEHDVSYLSSRIQLF